LGSKEYFSPYQDNQVGKYLKTIGGWYEDKDFKADSNSYGYSAVPAGNVVNRDILVNLGKNVKISLLLHFILPDVVHISGHADKRMRRALSRGPIL